MVTFAGLRRPRVLAVAAIAGLALTACGGVQTSTGGGSGTGYPSGTVEMYVGASPGGSSDLISRAMSKGLGDKLGASFPVINREGANGALAAAEVAKAKPDGSVIAIQNASLFAITPLAVSPDEVTKIDDFDVVYGVSRDDYVLVTSPASGYKSLADIEKSPRVVRYGTTGVGTGAQLAAALLFKTTDVASQPVPFDGGAPALAAVLGNQIDVASLQVGEAIENIQSGKLTPLTVFGPDRIEYLPRDPDREGTGSRRRGGAVPVHDGAEGHAAGGQGQDHRRHEGHLRDRVLQGVQQAEQPDTHGTAGRPGARAAAIRPEALCRSGQAVRHQPARRGLTE